MTPALPRIGFVGFGEAGQAIASGLREEGVREIAAWDILFPEAGGEGLRRAADILGVRIASSARDAVADADLIFSAVTAASSFEAAQSVAPHLHEGQYVLDINSVSPKRKQDTAALFFGGARYIDVAVMAPVHPARHQTPMLLAGPHAGELEPTLRIMCMAVEMAGPAIGHAAAIKMIRSIMIKGLEALTFECFAAATRAGVVDQVVHTLSGSFPTLDWRAMAAYNLERMATHGTRRAAEMEEVAATLRELGLAPLLATATAERQREIGRLGQGPAVRAALDGDLAAIFAALLNQLQPARTAAE